MKREHRDIQKKIKSSLEPRLEVCAEIDRQNRLPSKNNDIYHPDVVIRSHKTGKILHIIEVENDPTRKSIVGASILADYSIKKMKQSRKPGLTFVVYSPEGKAQLRDFEKRCIIVKTYCPRLKKIEAISSSRLRQYLGKIK